MKQFQGRVAVVTGGASGIGLSMARRFAAEGMKLVLADVEEGVLGAAAAELERGGADVLAHTTDVSSWQAVEALAAAAQERFGGAHLVCANAGVVTAGTVDELTLQDWEWVLCVNLWGVINTMKAFVPMLREQDEAHFVGTSSTAGVICAPGIAPYNVSKFGVVALMETLHRELAKTPVGVSVLCPGNVATGIATSGRNRPAALGDHADTRVGRNFDEHTPAVIAEGLSPEVVADQVLEAVKAQHFWIFTDPVWKQSLKDRVERLQEDRL